MSLLALTAVTDAIVEAFLLYGGFRRDGRCNWLFSEPLKVDNDFRWRQEAQMNGASFCRRDRALLNAADFGGIENSSCGPLVTLDVSITSAVLFDSNGHHNVHFVPIKLVLQAIAL